jgi:hypothetical protein
MVSERGGPGVVRFDRRLGLCCLASSRGTTWPRDGNQAAHAGVAANCSAAMHALQAEKETAANQEGDA